MIQIILSILSAILYIYTLCCLVYILMSWFPGAKFTKFGRALTKICEPYLGIFRKLTILRVGNIDFSPIISLGLLSLISVILAGIQHTGRIYLGGILGTIISSLWGILSSIIGIFILLIFIRWIVLLINKGKTSYDSGWNQLDIFLSKFTYKISATFARRSINYQTSLLVSWITLLIFSIAGTIIINYLSELLHKLPF